MFKTSLFHLICMSTIRALEFWEMLIQWERSARKLKESKTSWTKYSSYPAKHTKRLLSGGVLIWHLSLGSRHAESISILASSNIFLFGLQYREGFRRKYRKYRHLFNLAWRLATSDLSKLREEWGNHLQIGFYSTFCQICESGINIPPRSSGEEAHVQRKSLLARLLAS